MMQKPPKHELLHSSILLMMVVWGIVWSLLDGIINLLGNLKTAVPPCDRTQVVHRTLLFQVV